MIQKLFSMIKRRKALSGSICLLPFVLMFMASNPMQSTITEPPYTIGPTLDGLITQSMIDNAVSGINPTGEHWIIVIEECNSTICRLVYYDDFATDTISKNDFINGFDFYWSNQDLHRGLASYFLLDGSESNWNYTTTGNIQCSISGINQYNRGWVIASSDNFIFCGGITPWVIFQAEIEEPEPDYQVHPKPPEFDGDYPDETNDSTNILTKIFNRLGKIGNDIREFNNNIFDNFKDFFKPYLDNITQWIKDIRDYIFEEPDMTTCAQLVKESGVGQLLSGAKTCYDLFINAVRVADEYNSIPRFSWSFTLLEHEFIIAYDFGWYNSDVKRLFLSVFIPFWLLGCLIYLCKIIPDLLSGVSGFKGGD
ncbi:MAG: hypothetical protein MJ232_06905 [archaeon]|nr:hypothetical protein [archaeon]